MGSPLRSGPCWSLVCFLSDLIFSIFVISMSVLLNFSMLPFYFRFTISLTSLILSSLIRRSTVQSTRYARPRSFRTLPETRPLPDFGRSSWCTRTKLRAAALCLRQDLVGLAGTFAVPGPEPDCCGKLDVMLVYYLDFDVYLIKTKRVSGPGTILRNRV